jgi:hypothetical protein
MLVVQEMSRVKGLSAADFEMATQKLWQQAQPYGVVPGWFFEISHGTGPSYRIVSGLRLPDWTVWETVSRAMLFGELAPAVEELDGYRHDSDSCLLEVVSEAEAPAPEAGEAASIWVAQTATAGDGSEPAALSSPHLVMKAVLGGDDPGATTILRRAPATEVLDWLLDRGAPATGQPTGGRAQTWILRPVPWSPLR